MVGPTWRRRVVSASCRARSPISNTALWWLLFGLMSQALVAHASRLDEDSGERVTEPAPRGTNVHMLHEQLVIDMRPLASKQPIEVKTTYRVRNDGGRQTMQLHFASPGVRDGSITLQGRAVAGHETNQALSALDGPTPWAESFARDQRGSTVALELEPGEQTIEVHYRVVPDHLAWGLVDSFAIDYGLAPARGWASFGTLSLNLAIPLGWHVLDRPTELREVRPGNYHFAFAGLPQGHRSHFRDAAEAHRDARDLADDSVRVHVAPPRLPYEIFFIVKQVCCWLAVLVPVALGVRLSLRARRGRPVGLAQRLLSFCMGIAAVWGLPSLAFAAQQHWFPHGVDHAFPMVWLVGAWLLGALLCVIAHAACGWRAKRSPPGRSGSGARNSYSA